MKTYFYTYGENQDVTVCLMIDGNRCARGITIKSPDDRPSEELGQHYSKRHAYMALGESKRLGEIMTRTAIKVLMDSGCPFALKGEKNPVLTWQEVKMARLKDPLQFANIESRVMAHPAFAVHDAPFMRMLGTQTGRYHSGRQQGKSLTMDIMREVQKLMSMGRSEAFRRMYGGS